MKNFFLRYPRLTSVLPALLIFLATIIVYANSLKGSFLWDDTAGILHNTHIQNPESHLLNFFSEQMYSGASAGSAYWRPVILMLFSLEWDICYSWTPCYHSVSILVHALNGILIFYLFQKIFARKWLALLVALIFVTHPLQTQVVAYISGIGDPLFSFFVLLGTYTYIISQKNSVERRLYRLLTYLLLLFALMTKESAIIMPAIMLLADYFARQQTIRTRKDVLDLLRPVFPFIIIVALYILLRVTVLDFREGINLSFAGLTFLNRIFTFFHAFLVYLGLLFMPVHLHMDRVIPTEFSLWRLPVMTGAILLLLLVTLIFMEFKRRPAVSFGLVWFLIALAPNSNIFIPTVGNIAEHWLYLSLPGLFIAVFALLDEFFKKNNIGRAVVMPILLIVFFVFSTLTIKRNLDWDNPVRFFSSTLREEPGSYRAALNLGVTYVDQKEYEKGAYFLDRALKIDPYGVLAYHNRGLLYRRFGEKEVALKYFEYSVALDPYSPSFSWVYSDYIEKKEYAKAIFILEKRLEKTQDPLESQRLVSGLISIANMEGSHELVKTYLELSNNNEKRFAQQLYFPKLLDSVFSWIESFFL